MPLLQASGRRGEARFGGSVAAVTVGLEILRLRKIRLGSALPAGAMQVVGDFLRGVARDLLVQFPGNSWAATIARARQSALEIAGAETPEALEAAASMRIIAAAIEDYPEFFRKQG